MLLHFTWQPLQMEEFTSLLLLLFFCRLIVDMPIVEDYYTKLQVS